MSTLTAEYVRSRLAYDPETGALTWKRREENNRIDKMWNTRFAGKVADHKTSSGHIQFGIDGKNYLAHRIAWLIIYGAWPKNDIDHINRVRDDNRLCNLREATRAENASNTKRRSNNTSGYHGVSRFQNGWHAAIGSNYQKIHIGTFNCPTKAALAYDAAARNLHGEFATLNFARAAA